MEDIINYVKEWNLESSQTGFEDFIASKEQEGRDEGRIEGRQEEKIATAKNLINLKVPINVIQKATGLSKKKILSL